MTASQFDQSRLLPLLQEVESAGSLLWRGFDLIQTNGNAEPSPIFALLATGAEKLLKLSIGLLHWEEHQAWPTGSLMRNELGHNIILMHVRTLNDLGRRLADPATAGTDPEAVSALRNEVVDDPVATLTLRLLGEYAMQGRFHNLNTLAGEEPAGPSPAERWNELERGIINETPEASAVIGTPHWPTQGQSLVNERICTSTLGWWRLHQRAWNTGIFGPVAQTWSTYLRTP